MASARSSSISFAGNVEGARERRPGRTGLATLPSFAASLASSSATFLSMW